MKTINIVLFENNAPRRQSLQLLFNNSDGFNCKGAYKDGHQLLEIVQELQPDLLLIDIKLDSIDLMKIIEAIKLKHPGIRIIMQSNFETEQLFTAIEYGADGYLLNKIHPDKLLESIRSVYDGIPVFPATMAYHLLQRMNDKGTASSKINMELPGIETEIVKMVAGGYSIKYISRQLAISNEAIRQYVSRIFMRFSKRHISDWKVGNRQSLGMNFKGIFFVLYSCFTKRKKFRFDF